MKRDRWFSVFWCFQTKAKCFLGKQASINLLDSAKDMEGNEIACNNKDIKLPDLITFIEFMLERRVNDFGVLAEHPGVRWDLNAHLAFKFNKLNIHFRKPCALIATGTKALFHPKCVFWAVEAYQLTNSLTQLTNTHPGLGTPAGISSPVGPVPTLAQGGTGILTHWHVMEGSVLTEPGPNSCFLFLP